MKYDLIKDNTILQTKDFKDAIPPILSENKGRWLARIESIQLDYNRNTESIINSHVVTDTESQHGYSVIDMTQAEIDTNLAKLKETKLAEMKTARDEVVNGTTEITTSLGDTFVVDANIANRSTMHQATTNAVNAGFADTETINWKMGDNSYAILSYFEMKEIGVQLGVFINTQFQKEAGKINDINTATLETINSITWE